MRIIETKAYQFSELSEEAKQKAINNCIDNYNVLVPDCTYKMEREPGGDYVYAFMDVEIRHCFNPVSGTFFGVRVSGFIENVNAFYYRYKERIEAMVHPEDFFREIKAVRV